MLAGHVLLAGGPVRLAGHLGAARVARPPLHAEEVVVALCELAHAVALAGLLDDLRDGAARRVPVLLLALERRLDHLVGDVGRQPLEALLGGRVVPEAEQRAQQLRDGERAGDEGHDAGHRPEQGGRCARDRARDRGGGALRPRGSGRLARRLRGRLGRLVLGRGGRAGCLGAARASLWGAERGRRLAAALGCFLRLPLPQPSRGLLGRTPRVVHARGALELLRVVELGDGLPGDRQLRRIDARAHRGRRAPVAGWLGQFVPEPAFRRVGLEGRPFAVAAGPPASSSGPAPSETFPRASRSVSATSPAVSTSRRCAPTTSSIPPPSLGPAIPIPPPLAPPGASRARRPLRAWCSTGRRAGLSGSRR